MTGKWMRQAWNGATHLTGMKPGVKRNVACQEGRNEAEIKTPGREVSDPGRGLHQRGAGGNLSPFSARYTRSSGKSCAILRR